MKKLEIFYRVDPEIQAEEYALFGESPPKEFDTGGDTFDPETYKWASGVHRISREQFYKQVPYADDFVSEAKPNYIFIGRGTDRKTLWFVIRNGMYFVATGNAMGVCDCLDRHFKTRFGEGI